MSQPYGCSLVETTSCTASASSILSPSQDAPLGMHLHTLASFNLVSLEAAKIYRMQDCTFNKFFARELESGIYALPINVEVITIQIPWPISELSLPSSSTPEFFLVHALRDNFYHAWCNMYIHFTALLSLKVRVCKIRRSWFQQPQIFYLTCVILQ